jgi:hypothetical protein
MSIYVKGGMDAFVMTVVAVAVSKPNVGPSSGLGSCVAVAINEQIHANSKTEPYVINYLLYVASNRDFT